MLASALLPLGFSASTSDLGATMKISDPGAMKMPPWVNESIICANGLCEKPKMKYERIADIQPGTQWMDAGGRKDDKGASVLLAVAHRAAGALVTATSRASDAEYAAEHAMHSLEDTQLELNAVQAERDAARAAASASDERANRSNEELRDALNRLRDSDKKTQKLDEVIRRLASRS